MMAKVLNNENEGPGVVIPVGITEQAEAVAHAIEAAVPAMELTPQDTDPGIGPDGAGGDARRKPKRQSNGLPEGFPMIPLGKSGNLHHYLDYHRQLQSVPAKEHGRLVLESMVGLNARSYLCEYFPRKDRSGLITIGYKPEDVASALMSASAKCGLWSPDDRCRGAGAWRSADGRLILHAGEKIWRVDKSGETK